MAKRRGLEDSGNLAGMSPLAKRIVFSWIAADFILGVAFGLRPKTRQGLSAQHRGSFSEHPVCCPSS
jgi:hypothetical protein